MKLTKGKIILTLVFLPLTGISYIFMHHQGSLGYNMFLLLWVLLVCYVLSCLITWTFAKLKGKLGIKK